MTDGVRRGLARTLALAVVALGATGAYWLHVESGLDLRPETLRTWLEETGPFAPALFVAVVALRPLLLLPSWVVLVAGGILFGTVGGVLWGTLGGTAGAVIAFVLARVLGRDAIERRMSGAIARLDQRLGRHGPAWIALYSALPATPLTPAYYASGLTSMRLSAFVVAAAAGMVPRAGLYAFFGDSLLQADAVRIGVAVLLIAVGAWLAWALRRRLSRRRTDADPALARNSG